MLPSTFLRAGRIFVGVDEGEQIDLAALADGIHALDVYLAEAFGSAHDI